MIVPDGETALESLASGEGRAYPPESFDLTRAGIRDGRWASKLLCKANNRHLGLPRLLAGDRTPHWLARRSTTWAASVAAAELSAASASYR